MRDRDLELEPDAPDWSREPRSDDLLFAQLRERSHLLSSSGDTRGSDEHKAIERMINRLRELGIGN